MPSKYKTKNTDIRFNLTKKHQHINHNWLPSKFTVFLLLLLPSSSPFYFSSLLLLLLFFFLDFRLFCFNGYINSSFILFLHYLFIYSFIPCPTHPSHTYTPPPGTPSDLSGTAAACVVPYPVPPSCIPGVPSTSCPCSPGRRRSSPCSNPS